MTTEAPLPDKPLPVIDAVTQPFWDAAAQGRLVVQACEVCGHRQLPAAVTCAECGGRALGWVDVSGRGVVHTFTVLHRAYHPAFADELPYNVSIIELDEGPLLLSNVVGVPAGELRIGQQVEVFFEPVDEGLSLPKFAPAEKRSSD
jgi:uncharacterized OB-fold protein